MKKLIAILLALTLCLTLLAGCGGEPAPSSSTEPGSSDGSSSGPAGSGEPLRVGVLVDGKLGDNAANDDTYSGVQQFADETGAELTTIEVSEIQDHEINARNFAEEGYPLVLVCGAQPSELIAQVAEEYPETHFIILEGTVEDMPNVTCLRSRPNEAAFLTGAFNALMNKELGGDLKAAFVGGMRNPNLERSQYGFSAGCEYVGGECNVVYVGNFTDVAKAKEITLQLYNDGLKIVQAFAGGAGMGVYQAAEGQGEGYWALGAASGQFDLSDSILASQVKYGGVMMYNACMKYMEGTLEGGSIEVGLEDGSVGIKYNPLNEDKVPQEIKDQIAELEEKLLSGELTAPATEDEYNEFANTYLK